MLIPARTAAASSATTRIFDAQLVAFFAGAANALASHTTR
jgi:hypothetical protein